MVKYTLLQSLQWAFFITQQLKWIVINKHFTINHFKFRYRVLKDTKHSTSIFWDVTLCSLAQILRWFQVFLAYPLNFDDPNCRFFQNPNTLSDFAALHSTTL
jgi:hypothetical protein